MTWSDAICRGFLLAATAKRDRGAKHAFDGLCERLVSQCEATSQEYLRLDVSARARFLQNVASKLHGSVPIDNDLPKRAKALLVSDVPNDIARAWLATAGPVRTSFYPSEELRMTLRQLAVQKSARRNNEAMQPSELQQAGGPCQE